MWLLVSVSQPDLKYTILGDHRYVVGRQNCDIVISDASVSRKQAVLSMAHYEQNVVKSFINPTLTLEDTSKFGTYVNGKAVKNPGGNTITLKHNDEIKFGGTAASVFKAVYEPFLATTSCLEKGPKKSLHKVMCLLGGHLVRDWRPNCDILIMSKINVTIKVICAINNQKHIVVPQYLDDLLTHLREKREKPDPRNYLPEVVDQEVPPGVSFHPEIKRLTLLEGMKFYFLSPVQFNKTNLAVSTAGGQPILLEDGSEEEAEAMAEEGTVVVSVSRDLQATLSPSCHKFFKLVCSVLKKHSLRMITDPEIGWAILTCNVQDFCNPQAPVTPGMFSSMASQGLSQTMDSFKNSQMLKPTPIMPLKRPATSMQSQDRDIEQDNGSVNKVIKLEVPSQGTETGQNDMKTTPPVKTEPLSGQEMKEEVKKGDDSVTGDGLDMKDSSIVDTGLWTATKTKKQNQTVNEESRHSDRCSPTAESTTQNREPANKQKMATDDGMTKKTNVFALQRAKKALPSRITNLNDSDEEELISIDKKARKRKAMLAFDSDEEDDIQKKKRSGRGEKDQHAEIVLSSGNSALNSRGTNADDGPARDTPEPDENSRERLLTAVEEALVHNTVNNNTTSSSGIRPNPPAAAATPAVTLNGWLSAEKKSREDETDVKPDVDLLRDDKGNPLRNLCQVQTVELVARPTTSQTVPKKPENTIPSGGKNFKKFKKTQHVGAGKLPQIIGGRDLEVYLGNRHKDIEDLFSNGLAEENKREEEERRSKELFDWEERPRKAAPRKKR